MKKKLLAVLLSVAMVLSFMPFSAFAADETTTVDSTATPAITVSATDDGVVSQNGENFYVFDADDFAGTTFITTIAAEGATADAVAGTQYIGVRFKIDDATAAYYFQNSRFQMSVKISGTEYRIDDFVDGTTTQKTCTNWFVDYENAGLSQFFAASGQWHIHSQGIETTGSLDGVMLFPIANNAGITEAALAEGFEGITFTFINAAASGNIKPSDWDSKTVYIGDISFVDDYDAYYEAYISTTGKTKYNLNNGGTATTFTKVGAFRSMYRDYNINSSALYYSIGSDFQVSGYANDSSYSSTNSEHYSTHISTLPNGDRAIALKYNNNVPTYEGTAYLSNSVINEQYIGDTTTKYNVRYSHTLIDSYRDGFSTSDSRVNRGTSSAGHGLPTDSNGDYEIDASGTQAIVVRLAIAGGNEDYTVHWNMGVYATGASKGVSNGQTFEFIDANTGEVSTISYASSKFTTKGNLDGYIVLPLDTLSLSASDIASGAWYVYYTLMRGFYDGKTLYAGDSYFVEDVDKFKASLFAPDVELETEATDTTINVTNADGTLEYSIDGGNTWNTDGAFTGLTKDTEYTITVRYAGFTKTATHTVWTSPYSTHAGDSASYLMNVYDYEMAMQGSIASNHTTDTVVHYQNSYFSKKSDGTYGDNSTYLYIKELDGETFMEMDINEELNGSGQLRFYFNAFYGAEHRKDLGVPDVIDTTNLTHLAYRIKITGGTDGTASRFSVGYRSGGYTQKDLQNGAFVIDYTTGEIYTPDSWSDKFEFSGEFDGWIVLPFECIDNNGKTTESMKDVILGDVEDGVDETTACNDIQITLYHSAGGESDWTDRILYVGDFLVVEDVETFAKVRGCDELGSHSYQEVVTEPTCTEGGYTTMVCECGDSYVVEGSETDANGHDYEAVVTAPDCENGGYTTYTCSCGDSYVADETEANGHTEGAAVKENIVEATLNSTGSYESVVYCSVCGVELSRTTVITDKLSGAVASINGYNYASLAEAMAAVEDGQTITISTDITLGLEGSSIITGSDRAGLLYTGDKSFTLDLNGKTITSTEDISVDVLRFVNQGTKDNTITITNGTIIAHPSTSQAIDVGGDDYVAQADGVGTTLILEGLTIEATKGGVAAVRCREGNFLEVTDTTITTNGGGGIYTQGGTTTLGEGVNVTVGGPSNLGNYGIAINSCVSVSYDGVVTINGGTYTNNREATDASNGLEYVLSVMNSGGTMIINGGTFIGGRGNMIGVGALEGATSVLDINGGTFIPNESTGLIQDEGYTGTKNVVIGDVTCSSVTVSWNDMSFDESTATYTVEVNGEVVATDIESTSYELENLEPATTYNVRVMMMSSGATAIMTSSFTTPEDPEHNYNAVVTAPTCTEKGYTTYTCEGCGDSYVDNYVDALGHTEVIDAAVAPTNTVAGLTEGSHCEVCGEVIVAQQVVATPSGLIPDYTWYGDGSADTFYIANGNEFLGFANIVNGKVDLDGDGTKEAENKFYGKTIILTDDIDLQGIIWSPMYIFWGNFDGQEHTISNITFQSTGTGKRLGLFNGLGYNYYKSYSEPIAFSNVTISDVTVNIDHEENHFGTLSNLIHSTVNNVHIKNVSVTTSVSNDVRIGGLGVFLTSRCSMSDCSVTNFNVDAAGGAYLIGGFAAIRDGAGDFVYMQENIVVDGFNVDIDMTHETDLSKACGVAGFVAKTQTGYNNQVYQNIEVKNIDITAKGLVQVGGFVAYPGSITNVYDSSVQGVIDATGITNEECYVGGFVGNAGWNAHLGKEGIFFTRCSADVDIITGGAPAGGFIGSSTNTNDKSQYITFIDCSASGDVTSTGAAGGFAGNADRGVFTNCTASGTVSGAEGRTGTFVGELYDVTPAYNSSYPEGTLSYSVDEIFINYYEYEGESTHLPLIGNVAEGVTYTVTTTDEARINNYYYATLADAVAAAKDGDIIVLLKDAKGSGIVINESITIDFGGFTYTFTEGVGSTGTPSNGFQILKGNTVVLKNGKLDVAAEGADKLYILIQNYADLTITDMVLDGTYLDKYSLTDGDSYVLSVNSGNVTINGSTSIIANNDGALAYAIDSCKKASYTAPVVIIDTTGTISGNIEVTGGSLALENAVVEGNLVYASGSVTKSDAVALDAPADYKWVDGVLTAKDYVAQVGDDKYESLAEAIAAANGGDTVVLLANASGAGAVIDKSITIDFAGYTYSLTEAVGSTGTQSNGFQILKGNTVVIKGGKLTVDSESAAKFYILIQNYADLTVTDMVLDGTYLDKYSLTDGDSYVLSVNSGNVTINGSTSIIANNDGALAYAIDSCKKASYTAPVVIIDTTGTISGNIEVTGGNLALENAAVEGNLVYASGSVTKSDAVALDAPADYKWVDGVLTAKDYVAQIGDAKYESLAEAIAAANDGDTVVLLADVYCADDEIFDLSGLTLDLGGHTLYTGYLTGILVGNNFTVTNGTIDGQGKNYALWIGDYVETNNVIIDGVTVIGGVNVFNATNVTLKNTTVDASEEDYYAVWADRDVVNLVIESGSYTGGNGMAAIYTETSEIIVKGGSFSTDATEYCEEGSHTTANADGDYVFGAHSYEAVVTAPDCTNGGYTTYTCSCGDSYVDNYVDANGHSYEAVVTAPDCENGGYTTYTCSVCGDSYVADETEAAGHSYEAVVTAPTETEVGYTTYTCSACGDSYVSDYKAATKAKVNGVTATANGDVVRITWDATEHASKYIAYVYDAEGTAVKIAETTNTSISFGETEEGEYTVVVIAKVGTWFKIINADEVPVTVENNTTVSGGANEITRDAATITWDAVDGAIKYVIKIVGNDETIYRGTTGTSVKLGSLAIDTEYKVYINVKLASGYTGYTELTTFKTAPWAEVVLTATAGVTRYTLSWTEDIVYKAWIIRVVDGVKTQVDVVSGINSYNVPKTAGEYYITAKVKVNGAYRYVNSNTVTLG